MSVAVLVPWKPGCEHREAAWRWVRARYAERFPTWEIIEGTSVPFSRARGILAALEQTDVEIVVVADADVWCDAIGETVEAVADGWAIPHRLIHRLSQESTEKVLEGADWRRLPLSSDNSQDRRPYVGHPAGTMYATRRDVLVEVPPDPRFLQWGQEDDAHAAALCTLVGQPERGNADVVHLWHPPAERKNRRVGSDENLALMRRYKKCYRHKDAMRALIDEGRLSWTQPA